MKLLEGVRVSKKVRSKFGIRVQAYNRKYYLNSIYRMHKKNVLCMTLKRKWFDMILSGVKREEYREIKEYWIRRLSGKKFSVIQFSNGYGKNVPTFNIEFPKYDIGIGKKEWGAPDEHVLILSIGEVIWMNDLAKARLDEIIKTNGGQR